MRFYSVDTVIFDCDSTLSTIEGIDELARRAGVYEQLASLTTAAMEGKLKLEEVYRRRLDIIKPKRADIEWLAQRYLETIVPDTGYVITVLHRAGKTVHIVSGAIRQAILQLASFLSIPKSHVHAVGIRYSAGGEYTGYDENSPLARSGGKRIVCTGIIGSQSTALMIGDGITDLEVVQDRVHFLGFGGVIRRPAVANAAEDYITEPTLLPVLQRLIP